MRFLLLFILGLFTSNAVAQQSAYSLQQCIDYAWGHHPQLLSLEKGNAISLEQLDQVKASVQPSLAFNASQNLNMGRSIDPYSYQFTNEKILSNNFGLNSSVTLFSGFKYLRSKEQQQIMIEANAQNIAKFKNDLALSIANLYLQVLLLKEQVIALDTQMAQTNRQLVREEKLFESGKSNQNKVLQLKAQKLTEENRKTDVLSNLNNALINLKYSACITSDIFDVVAPDIENTLKQSSNYSFTSVFGEAEKNMAAVKYNRVNEEYYLKGIEVSRSGYYPSLILSGSLSSGYSSARKLNSVETNINYLPIGYLYSNPSEIVYGPVISNSFTQNNYGFGKQIGDNFSQFIGLNLRVPIFSNRANKTSFQIARINYERSKLETENTLLQLRKDIETALNAFNASQQKNSKNQEIVDIQQTILTNLDIYYQSGNMSLFDLLNQKNTLQQAQSSLIQSKYELVFRKLVLDYYSGKPIAL